jgi:hypothetical protein
VIRSHDPEQVEQLIERYLRHEMTPDEEQQWEEHYLACDHCFHLLKKTADVARFVRGVAAAETEITALPEHDTGWRALVDSFRLLSPQPVTLRPVLVAVLALIVVGIAAIAGWMRVDRLQQTLDGLRKPSVPLATYSLRGPYRGSEQSEAPSGPEVQLGRSDAAFLLRVPALPPSEPSSVYRAHIEGPDGTTVWTLANLRTETATRSFRIFCQGVFFEPGQHTLHIDEVSPTEGEVLQTFCFPFQIGAPPES